MIQITNIESLERLGKLKQQYVDQATAPLDGMWLCGFVPMARHFGFYDNEELVGYCCVNDDGYLLQFYLSPPNQNQASFLFDSILRQNSSPIGEIRGAFASTAEPHYLSLCLDTFSKISVHTLMYQLGEGSESRHGTEPIDLTMVKPNQVSEMVEFARDSVEVTEEWQTSYYTNLINRQELFAYWLEGRVLAAGECRGYDEYQTDYTDLGMMVAIPERRKGIATYVLKQLVRIAETRGLQPICSTTTSNIGSQKAIVRAGFIANNRIVQFDS